jgi:phosphotransferase system IIB component
MNCKDKKKFKTAEASSKASLRTKGVIDAFLNILDVNKFNKLNKEWTADAVKRFNITDKLFYNENDRAVANKEAFKQIDNAKGIIYPSKVNFNDLIGSKKNEVTSNKTQESSETNSNLDTNQSMLFDTKSLKDSFTSTEVLQNIINSNLDLSGSTINLIEKATKLLKNSRTRVKVISQEQFDKMTKNSEGDGTAVMAYNYDLGSVIYMPKSTLSNFSNVDIVSFFLHEVAHELSLKAILNPETMVEVAFNEFITKAFEQYRYLGKSLNNSNSYGFTNIQEFVAELYSNDKFQDEIKRLDKNFWQRFITEIRRLLGIPKSLQNDNLIDSILLIEKVDDFINESEVQLNNYKLADLKRSRILAKRIEDDSQYSSLESKIDNFIVKAKKAMQAIQERTIKSNRKKSTESKEESIKRNKELLDVLTKYETSQKWKAVVGYTQSFNNTINHVNSLLDKLLSTKNIYEDQLENTIKRYKDYLSAYDLLPEIKELMSQADLKLFELTEEEKEDYQQLKDFLSKAKEKHDAIESKFLAISKAQVLQDFSNPLFNTEVETKQREFLIREYNSLVDKGGLTAEQYVSKILTTRDKDDYEADLKASAEKILNDLSQDISRFSGKLDDQLNTKSKLIQVVNQMLGASFDKVKTLTVTKVKEMSKTFENFIKEKGNVKLSVLNKNLIEKDSTGQVYLKGKYSLAFKEAFDNELRPILNTRREYYESSIELGLEEGDILSSDKYKAFNYQISQWYKTHTTKDSKRKTIPKAKYLNKPLTGIEKEILDGYIKINQDNNEIEGFDSLITNIVGAEFHKLPSQSKSDLERALEADFKGITKDKWNDLTKIRTDDIGIDSGSEEKNSQGDILRRVKTVYRGKIDPNEQSLDLETMFRNEYWNGQNVREKLRLEPKLLMITDIARDKEYYTGKNKDVVPGLSNTYNRLVGLMERNVYDVMSYSGISFAGADINKVTSALNGYAAGLAMTFNLASGVTNIANGLTQVLIESVGGNRFDTKTFLKAEAKYTKEMMNGNLLKDMSKSVKTSYFNQLLEMFDVMGGLGQNEQEALRNTILRKFGTTKSGNFLNESGEHAMHAILTESILDGIKAMDENNNYLDKDGNITTEDKGASLAEMLYFDNNGQLQMNSKVAYSGFNLTTKYHEGGKAQINLLIKHKVFDLFGVYDIKYKNELSKAWWGKSIMMFKNFFMGAANYRYTGFATSYKKKSDLSEDDRFYNSAEKEYIEGTYTTLVRFLRETGVPNLKSLQTMYMNWNNLTEYEKSNVKKATMEIMLTAVILPSIGLLMAGMDDDDDESNLLWFAMYVNRRLTRELAQFRNPIEASKMIQNPVAGIRFIQNGLNFIYDVATPINFAPVENESVFGYLDENSKSENKMSKHLTKLIPIIPQMGVDYRQRFGLEFK